MVNVRTWQEDILYLLGTKYLDRGDGAPFERQPSSPSPGRLAVLIVLLRVSNIFCQSFISYSLFLAMSSIPETLPENIFLCSEQSMVVQGVASRSSLARIMFETRFLSSMLKTFMDCQQNQSLRDARLSSAMFENCGRGNHHPILKPNLSVRLDVQ